MDWNAAYSNVDAVPDFQAYLDRNTAHSAAFRKRIGDRARLDVVYGDGARQRYDLFLPQGTPTGLALFIHGGYWRRLSKDDHSFVADGALALGWAVAVPGYTLCPEGSVPGITQEIAAALSHAAGQVPGPIRIAGHSAGGHLATRMACADVALPDAVIERVAHVMPISGLFDLRPFPQLAMNQDIRLTPEQAVAESPCLCTPRDGTRLTAWVGAGELPELVRQSRLIANIWTGFGVETHLIEDTRRNHFDVIHGLADPHSPIVRCWLED